MPQQAAGNEVASQLQTDPRRQAITFRNTGQQLLVNLDSLLDIATATEQIADVDVALQRIDIQCQTLGEMLQSIVGVSVQETMDRAHPLLQ